jgi:hypothetical protein
MKLSDYIPLKINKMNGQNAIMKRMNEPVMSRIMVCLAVSGLFKYQNEKAPLNSSCEKKKRNTLMPFLFHSPASSILPLTIREKL